MPSADDRRRVCSPQLQDRLWRLLYSPEDVLTGATVCFLGINPGGCISEPQHDGLCVAKGCSAYRCESWQRKGKPLMPGQHPLQRRICELFDVIGVKPPDVLAGNLIPFRSPTIKTLKQRNEAEVFSAEIWRSILERVKPQVVIAMGREARRGVSEIVCAKDKGGDFVRDVCRYGNYVGIRHLSRRLLKKTELDCLAEFRKRDC